MHSKRTTPSPLWAYIEENLADRDLGTHDLVRALGVHRSRLTDWKRGKSMTIDTARAMCKFFDKPLLELLVVGGIITPEEARADGSPRQLADYSATALVAEVQRRLGASRATGDGKPAQDGTA
ncbi:helix-turn-helix domain-containing protein [Actinosynnema sp. CA-248983]